MIPEFWQREHYLQLCSGKTVANVSGSAMFYQKYHCNQKQSSQSCPQNFNHQQELYHHWCLLGYRKWEPLFYSSLFFVHFHLSFQHYSCYQCQQYQLLYRSKWMNPFSGHLAEFRTLAISIHSNRYNKCYDLVNRFIHLCTFKTRLLDSVSYDVFTTMGLIYQVGYERIY